MPGKPETDGDLSAWSPEALVDLLDGANDIVYLHDLEGTFLWLSQAVQRHLGWEPKELVGRGIDVVVHPDELQAAKEHMRQKSAGERDRSPPYELRLRDKDGRETWFEISSRVVRRDGKAWCVQGTARDITQRRALRERVEEREAELRDWLERIPLGVYRTMPDGTILDGNRALCDILGAKDLDELKTVPAHDLFQDAADRQAQIDERAADRSVSPQDVRMKRIDGTPIWARDVGRAVVMDGEIQWLDGTLEDITQAKRDAAAVDLLRDLAVSLGGVHDMNDALVTTLERVQKATGWPYGEAWSAAEGRDHFEVTESWHGARPEYVQLHRLARQMRHQGEEGLPGQARRDGTPLLVDLDTEDSGFVRAGTARQLGLHAAVALPVIRHDKCMAVLMFLLEDLDADDEAWIDPLQTITRQLGDVFLRARAEQRRQDAERLQRALVRSNPDAVLVVDADGEVVDANERFLDLCGLSSTGDSGPLGDRVDDPARLDEALDQFYRMDAGSGDELEWEGRVLRRTRAPVTDPEGNIVARVWRFTEARGLAAT